MIVTEYERKFLELSEFYPYIFPDEERKKKRFLDDLRDAIAISIFKRTSSSTPGQGSSKRGSSSLRFSSSGRFRGSRSNPNVKSGQSSGHDMRSGQ
ncbi:hypothetical protein FNV43_RR13359 [Rhamnella rubrinervis]|uniref:Retrotransposon gag domain-containing protein n=1 Tax=Rhamnella rubrinervis TaxID=2594499 RepID=A0A8K0H0X9_9ROSA|nr:hypothetical protein FNV43_RR13359 [Rhamnella rubrinervis]